MIVLSDAQGNIQNITPARVYQGSNDANDFNLIAPFANSNIITIAFLLPNTIDGTPQEFAQMDQPKTLNDELNTWTYKLPIAVTQYYGTVRYQFKVTNQSGVIIATGSGTFEVIRGVDVDLPVEPTTDVYMQILTALSQVYADFTNKVDITYTDVQNAIEQKVLNNYNALALQRTHDGETNTLSFDDDGVKVNGIIIGTIEDIATAVINHNTSKTAHADIREDISNILDGTTPVAEATHAESATNVSIINNDSGNNANINFNIGTGSYNKTVNNVANANTAINYAVGGSIDSELKLIKQIALDRENALVFANNQQIIDWIAGTYERPDGKTVADLTIGLTIYNQDATQADYWVSQLPVTSISDLTPFDSDVNPLDAINVEFDASINENKLEADNVQEAIDELTNIAEEKTNIYELGQFTLESADWALNSTSGLYEYIFTNEYLTSATNEIIEVTPSVESAKLINSNNLVIYNDIEIRQGVSAVEAVIKAQSAPSFDIVCYVRLKTVAMRLSGAGSLHASQVIFVNTGTGLGATNVQSVITEINTKADTNLNELNEYKISANRELNKLKLSTKPKLEKWVEKTWNGDLPPMGISGNCIWTDGNNIYFSENSAHYVLNVETSTWEIKRWNGAPTFLGRDVWRDGEKIYASDSLGTAYTYELNIETSTWTRKVWNGYDTIYGECVWTDGKDIYYSFGENQYVLDRETSTWTEKSWNGLTNFDGDNVWTDGINIYYSAGANQYILNTKTSTWTEKTWNGLVSFYGYNVWTDGINIYYSDGTGYHILDIYTSTWTERVWNAPSLEGRCIWTDGKNIYYSSATENYILNKFTL